MNKEEAIKKAEELSKMYNPEGISPFPFERILEDNKDLKIYSVGLKDDKISGVIFFDKKDSEFNIVINNNKPVKRKYFTTAHELGHYFLHKDLVRGETLIVDGDHSLDGTSALYRLDNATCTKMEVEANNFAASLIMPKDLTKEAWKIFKDAQKCADLFKVSLSAMSIRLEQLNLIKTN